MRFFGAVVRLVSKSPGRGVDACTWFIAMLGGATFSGCTIGDTGINSHAFSVQASDDLAGTDDTDWIVRTILEAEQFHCDPNPQVVMFGSHLCTNMTTGMTLEYRIEDQLVQATLHGPGTAASRRDRSILMRHVATILGSFSAAGFRPVDSPDD